MLAVGKLKKLAKKMKSRAFGAGPEAQAPKLPFVVFEKPELPVALLQRQGRNFRVALIGAGAQGRGMLKGAAALKGVDLIAVADRNAEVLANARKEFPGTNITCFADASELLRDVENLDLLVIATNSPSHVKLTEMAIQAGVRRICVEKPMGTQVRAAKALLSASKNSPVKIAVNFTRRWSRDFEAIKSILQSGQIGSPVAAYCSFSAGGLGGKAVHFVDLLRFLMSDEIAEVSCRLDAGTGSSARGSEYFDPSGNLMLRFRNGARALIDVSKDLSFDDRITVIKTTEGRIEINERSLVWTITSAAGSYTVPMVDRPKGTMQVLRSRIFSNLLGDEPVKAGVSDGVAALEAIVAAHLSHSRGGSFVSLPLSEEDAGYSVNFP